MLRPAAGGGDGVRHHSNLPLLLPLLSAITGNGEQACCCLWLGDLLVACPVMSFHLYAMLIHLEDHLQTEGIF